MNVSSYAMLALAPESKLDLGLGPGKVKGPVSRSVLAKGRALAQESALESARVLVHNPGIQAHRDVPRGSNFPASTRPRRV